MEKKSYLTGIETQLRQEICEVSRIQDERDLSQSTEWYS